MKKVIHFINTEVVLCVSLLLAVISAIAVHPDGQYASYIDYRTLSILLSLMLVMAGLRRLGVFGYIGKRLLEKTGTVRSLALVLVLLCFCFSMVITNDVALITFVPFTVEVLTMASLEKYMIRIIVLQTVAANLGSMLTPIGNPQNLYLYGLSGMTPAGFIGLMLPYSLLSLAGLLLCVFLMTGKEAAQVRIFGSQTDRRHFRLRLAVYLLLFALSLTTVARLVPYYIVLAVVLVVIAVFDWRTLPRADYALLLTFVFLFIFIGNMKRIDTVSALIGSLVTGRETAAAILTSQVISNVPAAILLSGFTDQVRSLIVGTNLGGLGTIIASMASLISFKFYSAAKDSRKGRYLGIFTVVNLIFLAALWVEYLIFTVF